MPLIRVQTIHGSVLKTLKTLTPLEQVVQIPPKQEKPEFGTEIMD